MFKNTQKTTTYRKLNLWNTWFIILLSTIIKAAKGSGNVNKAKKCENDAKFCNKTISQKNLEIKPQVL